MIADAIDTLIALGWALLAWIAVAAFVGTVVLLGGTAVGAWAVRGLWRTVRAWMPRPAASVRATRPRRASRPAGTIPSLTGRQTDAERRTPSWAVTDHHNHQDAA